MLNKDELKRAAEVAFVKEINRLVNFIAGRCWNSNLPAYLGEINGLLCAAAEMEITGIPHLLNESEIAELTTDLRPLRALKMDHEAKAHIIKILVAHGVPAIAFACTEAMQGV